jgi:hypothetical protein
MLQLPEYYRPYDKLPMLHLLIGSVMLITNSNWEIASKISISFLSVIILATFTFLIARFICNSEKIGLLAAVLVVSADMILLNSLIIFPNFLGLIFMLILIYLIFMKVDLTKGKKIQKTALVVFFMIALILTHPQAGMSFGMVLIALWLVPRIRLMIHKRKDISSVSIFIVLFFLISMFAYWIYTTGYVVELVHLIKIGFSREKYGGLPSEEVNSFLMRTSSFQYLLNRMGSFIFYIFAFIGFLYFLAKRDKYNIALAFTGLGMIGFGGLGLLFKLRNFETRFLLASQFILTISAVCGIVYVIYAFKSRKVRQLLFTVIVTLTFFFMITSSLSNFDNPIYTENDMRLALTQSEIQSMTTIDDTFSERIIIDEHPIIYFSYKNNYYLRVKYQEFMYIDELIIQNRLHNSTGLIIIREYIIHNPFKSQSGLIKINNDPREELDEEKVSHIYESGSVHGFLNTER